MTVEWLVPRGQARAITIALHSLMTTTRAAHGCIGCSTSTDLGDRDTVRYTEEWRTEEDLRGRLRSDTFHQLAALVDNSTGPARVEFDLPSGKRGLDFVEETRQATK
jgi:quinol monooxygenase YgiN